MVLKIQPDGAKKMAAKIRPHSVRPQNLKASTI